MRKAITFMASVVLGLGLLACPKKQFSYSLAYEQGIHEFYDGNLRKSKEIFKAIVNSGRVPVTNGINEELNAYIASHHMYGRAIMYSGDFKNAAKELREAKKLSDRFPGTTPTSSDKNGVEFDLIDRLTDEDPDNDPTRNEVGKLYQEITEPDNVPKR